MAGSWISDPADRTAHFERARPASTEQDGHPIGRSVAMARRPRGEQFWHVSGPAGVQGFTRAITQLSWETQWASSNRCPAMSGLISQWPSAQGRSRKPRGASAQVGRRERGLAAPVPGASVTDSGRRRPTAWPRPARSFAGRQLPRRTPRQARAPHHGHGAGENSGLSDSTEGQRYRVQRCSQEPFRPGEPLLRHHVTAVHCLECPNSRHEGLAGV